MNEHRFALQIYTFNHASDLGERFSLAADCGYRWVETEGLHGLAVGEFLDLLERHCLKLASMHADMTELRTRLPDVRAALQRSSCHQLVMPWLDESERPLDRAGWLTLAAELQQLAQLLREDDIRLAYHNHAFEFARLSEEETVLDLLLAMAPDLHWQADVAWVVRAGEDPSYWLSRYADRLQSIHVKDYCGPGGNPAENDWATPGEGQLPWPALFSQLQPQIRTWMVEHDQPLNPVRTARQGLQFLRQHLH